MVPTRLKPVVFRCGAVLCGLSVFLAVELICVAFDLGASDDSTIKDPFVGFAAIHPLFERVEEDNQPARYQIRKERRKFFAPDSFAATKPSNTFRIFCFGGSTVQGRPFSKETSFTTWLRISLSSADPSRQFEVVNCGGVSYASYRLVPILRECLNYEPDLFIICTGHNEFLEERTYGTIKHTPQLVASVHQGLSRLRSYSLLRSTVLDLTSSQENDTKFPMPDEVDAFLDYRNGLDAYHRDDQWRDGVIAHFDLNARNMLTIARNANVPAMLIIPPSNLSDCPPFKSEHDADLGDENVARFRLLFDEAKSHYKTDLLKAVSLLKDAIEIDRGFAVAHYELGRCYETLKDADGARSAFVAARDTDICPLRILSPMEESLRRLAEEFDGPLIDAHQLLEESKPNQILGDFLLVDHIHPSFRGHQMIADELTRRMQERGYIELGPNWESTRRTAYDEHFAKLEDVYFLRGRRMLEILDLWTKGRADGPELSTRKSTAMKANE